jgi:hypothetical protein
MKMMRRSKKSGMTTMELVVSGSVMLGVIIMGFDVMLAGVQVSKKASNDSQANEQNRSMIERFNHDVQNSIAVMGGTPLLGLGITSDKERVVLKVPKFDAAGRKIANSYQLISYYLSSSGKGKCIKRSTCNYNGLLVSGLSTAEVVLDNLEDIQFQFGKATTLTYDTGASAFLLPGKDADKSDPDQGKVSLTSLKCSWGRMLLDTRDQIKSSPAVSISNNKVQITGALAGSTADAAFFISSDVSSLLVPVDLDANFVRITAKVKKSEGRNGESTGQSTLITTASLRNAQ